MTDELVFEEPVQWSRGGWTRPNALWLRLLTPVMERPGQWARVRTTGKKMALHTASELRTGKKKYSVPPGRWEFYGAPIPGQEEWGVYAKYLGPVDAGSPSPATTTNLEGAGGPARPLAGTRADRTPPAPPPSDGDGEARSTSPAAPARRREDRTLVLPRVPGVNAPGPARETTTADGQPKCARKGCSRPAGKGSPWCVPQRWCEGRGGAAVADGPRAPLDPLKNVVELPPPPPMPQSGLLTRMRQRTGRG